MASVRVLHLDTGRERRGGQVQLELLVRGLAARGVEQRVLAGPGGARVDGARLLTGGRWAYAGQVSSEIRSFRPDLIAVHTAHALAAAPRGGPVVVHRRNDFVPSWFARSRYAAALGVVAVSRAVARIVRRAGATRVVVVRDGVASSAFRWEPPREPCLIAVGALVPHKDHATLIAAMVDVPARLDICGEGPLRPQLERSIRELGLVGRVRLVGQVDDVTSRLARATALVHPSVEEGLGQVVLEALAVGAPVAATTAGGVAEVLGPRAVLVSPGEPARWVAALRRVVADPWAFAPSGPPRDEGQMVDETLSAYQLLLR